MLLPEYHEFTSDHELTLIPWHLFMLYNKYEFMSKHEEEKLEELEEEEEEQEFSNFKDRFLRLAVKKLNRNVKIDMNTRPR